MIEMRARKLIETKCDRFALNFVTEALRVIRLCTDEHLLRQTVSLIQHQSLLEIYFSLLYKFKESSRLKTELETMDVQAAKEFILNSFATIDIYVSRNERLQRLKSQTEQIKPTAAGRLHKYQVSLSQYALQLILTRILSAEYSTDGLDVAFRDLLTEWIRRKKHHANFGELFHKLVQTTASSSYVYDCCEILYEMV